MARLRIDLRHAVDLPETSDVAELPARRFVIVSDKKPRAAILGPDGNSTTIDLHGIGAKKVGLEAVAFDEGSGKLFVFSEEQRVLSVYAWSPDAADDPTLESQHEISFGDRKNKGVEGMIHLSAAESPTSEPGLLLANEGRPPAIFFMKDGLFDPAHAVRVELDAAITDACDDFSGLAFDPVAKRVLLVSDESSRLVEMTLRASDAGIEARCEAVFDLVDENGTALERVEGVAVERVDATSTRRWVLLEDDRELCRVAEA